MADLQEYGICYTKCGNYDSKKYDMTGNQFEVVPRAAVLFFEYSIITIHQNGCGSKHFQKINQIMELKLSKECDATYQVY
jgi:hypothetical protein